MTNRVISFFEKIGHDLREVFTSTTWETKVISTIQYTEPIVVGILGFVDPVAVPFVSRAMTAIVGSLETVKSVVQQGTVAPGSPASAKVVAELNSVKSNLSAILADAHIKNSAKVAQITAAVDIVDGEVDAMLGEAPAPAVSA